VPEHFRELTVAVEAMVHSSLEAFLTENAELARQVCECDAQVDADHAASIEQLIREMKSSPECVEPALSLFSAIRHLERMADHAVIIAERTIFLVEGEVMRCPLDSAGTGGGRDVVAVSA
jgi:phosphate transport system protein